MIFGVECNRSSRIHQEFSSNRTMCCL